MVSVGRHEAGAFVACNGAGSVLSADKSPVQTTTGTPRGSLARRFTATTNLGGRCLPGWVILAACYLGRRPQLVPDGGERKAAGCLRRAIKSVHFTGNQHLMRTTQSGYAC
jgi:hypothetical protein